MKKTTALFKCSLLSRYALIRRFFPPVNVLLRFFYNSFFDKYNDDYITLTFHVGHQNKTILYH